MKYHRLIADDAGESRWQEVEIALETRSFAPPAEDIELSEPDPSTQTVFLRLRAGWKEPVHCSPVRQRLVCLAGCVRVTASDGETRDIGRGDVWQMEDLTGKGHHTAVIGDEDFEALVVQFG